MDLEERLAALLAPGRGATEEDCMKMAMEHITFMQDRNTIFLDMREGYAARRDVNTVSGKLAVEYNRLAGDANASATEKKKFLRHAISVIDKATAEADASPSGDLITEIYREILQSCQACMGALKLGFDPVFILWGQEGVVHPLESTILMFENATRMRQMKAAPAPLKTFCMPKIKHHTLPVMESLAKPNLDKLLASGPCDWLCTKKACLKGLKSEAEYDMTCSVGGHKDCLFIRVVEREGSNVFDFGFGKGK